MLTVLSPAKSLDFESPLPTKKRSEPRLLAESAELISILREKSPADISALMHISDELAHLNATRYADFTTEPTTRHGRPAVLAFNGDVYQGLSARSLSERDLTEAQKTVRILSGLYGVLRPLDLIQPHRLEMGTRLDTPRGRSLYDWWGDLVTDLLRQDLADSPGSAVVINLASQEYFAAVRPQALGVRVISPRFEDRDQHGEPRVVSFYAKRARGTMAAWLIRGRVRTPRRLVDFHGDGYTYDEARSTQDQPLFVR